MELILLLLIIGLITLFVMPFVALAVANRLRREVEALREEQTRLGNALERLEQHAARADHAAVRTESPFPESPPANAPSKDVVTATLVAGETPHRTRDVHSGSPPIQAVEAPSHRVDAAIHYDTTPAAVGRDETVPAPQDFIAELLSRFKPKRMRVAPSESSSSTRAVSLEERLGAKLPVWLGAIALMLAGVFLVAFAVKRGWFTPRMRVYASAALGAGLIVSGLGLRRSYSDIAQGLAAAGVGILYAVVLAMATIFHGEFAFATSIFSLYLIVGVTALAIALSLYLGPLVALIGLVGGFATPALIGVGPAHTTPLFLCLIAQQLATSIVGHRNGQWLFSLVALVAIELYVAVWMLIYWDPAQAPLLGGAVLASVVCFCATIPIFADSIEDESPDVRQRLRQAALWLPVIPAIVLSSILVARSELNFINVALHATQLVGIMVYSRIRPAYFGLFPVAAGISVAALLLRIGAIRSGADGFAALVVSAQWSTLVFALIIGVGSALAAWSRYAVHWWTLVGTSGLVALGLAPHVALEGASPAANWLGVGGGLVAIAAAAALLTNGARRSAPAFDLATTLYLTGFAALALLAIAYWIQLDNATRYWFAVGCGGLTVLVALLARVWRLVEARWLASALAAVLAFSLLNPVTLSEPLGPHWIGHRAVLGFGAAIASMVAAALLLRGDWSKGPALPFEPEPVRLESWFYAGAAVLLSAFLCVQVRHAFDLSSEPSQRAIWLEVSTDLIALSAVGLVVLAIARSIGDPLLRQLSRILTGLALVGTLAFSVGTLGPLVQPIDVGRYPLVNWISYTIGAPFLVAGLFRLIDPAKPDRESAFGGEIKSLSPRDALLIFWVLAAVAFVLVHIRHGFWRDTGSLLIQEKASFHVCEIPVYAVILGLMSGFAGWRRDRSRSEVWRLACVGFFIGFVLSVSAVVLWLNPLLVPRSVGAMPIWNLLWVIFAAPAAVAAGLAYWFGHWDQRSKSTSGQDPESWAHTIRVLGQIASVVALFFVWLLITAQVRQSFVGSVLPGVRPEQNEWYAYSAAWILLAIALLTIGVLTRSSALRWGSLVLMLLSVCKVFLFDTRQLGDLWRVASYLGLGISLMLVAFVYQRFVFRMARGTAGRLP